MEVKPSSRTIVIQRLKSLYKVIVGKDELFRYVCGYNDLRLNYKNYNHAIKFLSAADKDEFYKFYTYVYDIKFIQPIE